MRYALATLAFLLACRDAPRDAPPTVVAPAGASASSTPAIASATVESGDAGPETRLELLRTPPPTVQALLDALRIAPSAVWESREKSGMGSLLARAPAPGVISLRVTYRWDPYHTNPVTSAEGLGPKSLESWSLTLAPERRDGVLRTLLGRWGASVLVQTADGAAADRYGPFFVHGDTVEWFANTPDWAKPKIDPATRKQAIAAMARAIATAQTPEELLRAVATPYPGAGITSKGAYNQNDANLELEPPMNALEFAAALGHPKVIGQSVGVHMSQWKLVEVNGSAASTPRLGIWAVEASLDGRPSGAKDPRFLTGPTAHDALGPTDVVRFVRFAKPSP